MKKRTSEIFANLDALQRGVDLCVGMVKETLGSYDISGPEVIRRVRFDRTLEGTGAELVRSAIFSTNRAVGDGSTTSAVLTQAMTRGALEAFRHGANPRKLMDDMDRAVKIALGHISRETVDASQEALERILAASIGHDSRLAELISEVSAASRGQSLRLGDAALQRIVAIALHEDIGRKDDFTAAEKLRIKRGLRATSVAHRSGVAPGGGSSFLHAMAALGGLSAKTPGIRVVELALAAPLSQLVQNAGYDAEAIVRGVGESPGGWGFDVRRGDFVEMISAGIVEPHGVQKSALEHALSATRKALAAITGEPSGELEYFIDTSKITLEPFDTIIAEQRRVSKASLLLKDPGRDVASIAEHGGKDQRSGRGDAGDVGDVGNGGNGGDGNGSDGGDGGDGADDKDRAPEPSERRVLVWISDHSNRKEPLKALHSYTLNAQVGAVRADSFVPGSVAPITDVPSDGLVTKWVFLCRGARLDSIDGKTRTWNDESKRHGAEFSLTIPENGASDIIKLLLIPAAEGAVHLHAIIYVGSEAYREFDIIMETSADLDSELAQADDEVKTSLVSNDTIHVSLGQTALALHHEWTTPEGTLSIAIFDKTAIVMLDIAGKAISSFEPWNVQQTDVAGLIDDVRAKADGFRTMHDEYLNDIDIADFEERLRIWTPDYVWDEDHADDAHKAAWKIVETSAEFRKLAYAGSFLYDAFFPRNSKLREELDRAPKGLHLTILCTKSSGQGYISNVPWGLMYLPQVTNAPIDPMGFMALRFRIEYIAYNSGNDPAAQSKALGSQHKAYRAHLIYWGSQADDQAAIESVWQREQWKDAQNLTLVPPTPTPAKVEMLEILNCPRPEPTSVLYLYCQCSTQGNNPILDFAEGPGTQHSISDYELGTSVFQDAPLVFANACATASNKAYYANKLEHLFFTRQCRAYLGTETKVPVTFASRFAIAFFRLFYREMSCATQPLAAGEAVTQARLFFWRHYRNIGGLFYTYVNKYDLFMADEDEILIGRK